MGIDELTGKYERLKRELDAAYCASQWDAGHIDRITSDLAHLERSLGSHAYRSNTDGNQSENAGT